MPTHQPLSLGFKGQDTRRQGILGQQTHRGQLLVALDSRNRRLVAILVSLVFCLKNENTALFPTWNL